MTVPGALTSMVTVHLTLHGRHVASTMPLRAGAPATGAEVAWTFVPLWRVADGRIADPSAGRDDVGLLRQVGARPPPRA